MNRAFTRWLGSWPAIAVTVLALLVLTVAVLRHARPSTEAVRLRNALLWTAASPTDFDWLPAQVPASFKVDEKKPRPFFDQIAGRLGLAHAASDWDRSLLIARHLLDNPREGNPAQDDLEGTYRKILKGEGYCADYTSTLIVIAQSAGIFVREWAFSFDGFGGHGHAVTEIFDRDSRSWRFLDAFNNFYVVDASTGVPLSALAFRQRLRDHADSFRIVRAAPGPLGFRDEAALLAYYRAGADQWYLWWGNAVYRYDESPATRLLGPVSRSLEQLGAIALGVHPAVRAIPTDTNQALRARMARLHWVLLAQGAGGVALFGLLVAQLHLRKRRSAIAA